MCIRDRLNTADSDRRRILEIHAYPGYGRELRAKLLNHLVRRERSVGARLQFDVETPVVSIGHVVRQRRDIRILLDDVSNRQFVRNHRIEAYSLRRFDLPRQLSGVLTGNETFWNRHEQIDGSDEEEHRGDE